MWAKLIIKGDEIDIYVLHLDNGKCEVETFFEKKPKLRNGFFPYLEHIADEGTHSLTREQFDCWKEGKEMFCELKKQNYRIGCFQGQKKLLLINVFSKTNLKEKSHYKKAVRLKKEFDNSQIWR
ncbi:MAG: hypothetical protein PF693_15725 [Spirochaetia bacterium]|jgi:hypothetical protein|nr:hypothetical protein [Spirochaetia bacterium]